jgi:hypothetical protein
LRSAGNFTIDESGNDRVRLFTANPPFGSGTHLIKFYLMSIPDEPEYPAVNESEYNRWSGDVATGLKFK